MIDDFILRLKHLCGVEQDCLHRNDIIHPETCLSQVMMMHDGELNLLNWITQNGNMPFDDFNSLYDWLCEYYPHTGGGGVNVSNGTAINVAPNGRISLVYKSNDFKIENGYLALADNVRSSITVTPNPAFNTGIGLGNILIDGQNTNEFFVPQMSAAGLGVARLGVDGVHGRVLNFSDTEARDITLPVGLNSQGQLCVDIPYTLDSYLNGAGGGGSYELPAASDVVLGGIQLGFNTDNNNRNYAVQVDDYGNAFVNVPWQAGNDVNVMSYANLGVGKLGSDPTEQDYWTNRTQGNVNTPVTIKIEEQKQLQGLRYANGPSVHQTLHPDPILPVIFGQGSLDTTEQHLCVEIPYYLTKYLWQPTFENGGADTTILKANGHTVSADNTGSNYIELVAGGGVTITADEQLKTITISATGSGGSEVHECNCILGKMEDTRYGIFAVTNSNSDGLRFAIPAVRQTGTCVPIISQDDQESIFWYDSLEEALNAINNSEQEGVLGYWIITEHSLILTLTCNGHLDSTLTLDTEHSYQYAPAVTKVPKKPE